MKHIVILSALIFSFSAFSEASYNECMDRAYADHHGAIVEANTTYEAGLKSCYTIPDSERFYLCKHSAQERLENAKVLADIRLKNQSKVCLKYPWL